MNQRSPASIPNIAKDLQAGKVRPVYLLCGEEDYLIENTLKQMLDALLEPGTRDFNLTFLDGVVTSAREVLSAVEVYPMMADWRVVVVRESPIFKARKGTSPLELIQSALDIVEENPLRAVSVMVKVLGVSAQEMIDRSSGFNDALNELIEDYGEDLDSTALDFLRDLPQIASQIDNLQSVSEGGDDRDLVIEWLQGNLPQTGVLIFVVRGSVDKRSRLVKAIDQAGQVVSFDPLTAGNSLQQDVLFQSVSKRLEALGKKITPGGFNRLRQRTGGDMHLIFEGLEKITAFVGEKTQIDERDIQNIIAQSSFDNIFALTDAIGKRSVAQAIASLHSVLNSGEPPIKVNALIVRQIRLTLQAKLLVERGDLKPNIGQVPSRNFDKVFKPVAAQSAKLLPDSAQINVLKQHPFAAYKIMQTLPRFSLTELVQGLQKTLDADIQLKSSPLSPEIILEQLVYELCSKPRLVRQRR